MSKRTRSRRGLAHWLISAGIPLFVLDSRRVVLVFNRGSEELTGWAAADIIGQSCHYVVQDDMRTAGALTSALAPPQEAYLVPCLGIARSIPCKSAAVLDCELQFFPIQSDEEKPEPRVLGFMTLRTSKDAGAANSTIDWHARLCQITLELRANYRLSRILAITPAMRRVLAQLDLSCSGHQPVHFHGSTGTGKEFLARCLHSGRELSTKPFVPLDCRALSHFEMKRTLQRAYDREIHGSEPAGTLFLRNIDCLARDLQEYLLTARQQFPDLWRICSSSSSPFEQAVSNDRCSAEFYCQLTTVCIQVPPLRDRAGELPLLAQQILEDFNRLQSKNFEGLSPEVQAAFAAYQWPANMRELTAVVTEACQNCDSHELRLEHLPFRFRAGQDAQRSSPPLQIRSQSLDDYLQELEAARIREVLQQVSGNKTAAAQILGLPRPKLYRRIEALGISDAGQIETDDDEQ